MGGRHRPGLLQHDTHGMKTEREVRMLIRELGSSDTATRENAVDTIGKLGEFAMPRLHDALRSHNPDVRLGAVEALAIIRNRRSVPFLLFLIEREKTIEIRWGAILALGEIGDPSVIRVCVPLLRDPSRYIRYGSAITLQTLGWSPRDEQERAYNAIALQDWSAVAALGKAAAGPLLDVLKDDDPPVRVAAVSLLGRLGGPQAEEGCEIAIRDRRDPVRFSGVLSAVRSGLARDRLPLLLARRDRTGPDPLAAALLNFFFIGIGYNYIGKWWGFLVFMGYMSVIVLAQFALGPFLPFLLSYPVTGILAICTYREAQRMRGE